MSMIRTFALACLLAAPAAADEARFLAFDLPIPLGTYQVVPAGEDSAKGKPVEIAANRFSERLKLAGGQYRLLLPDGKTGPSFTLAGDTKRTLFIVLPAGNGSVGLAAVPDNPAEFGPGDRWFLNVTPGEIRVQFGERNLRLPPGTGNREKAPAKLDEGRIPVRMMVQKNERWVPFNSTWWPHDPGLRSIVVIHPHPGNGLPMVKNIAEPAETEQAAAR
jgi:hypothetical protein